MTGPAAPSLPTEVAPPGLALDDAAVHAVAGADVLALPVLVGAGGEGEAGPVLGPGAAETADALGLDLLAVLEAHEATGAVGEVVVHALPESGRRLLLVGVGAATAHDVRRAGATLARATRGRGTVATTLHQVCERGIEPLVVGAVLASFSFHWRSSAPTDPPALQRLVLAGTGRDDAGHDEQLLDRAEAVALASWRARTLATTPSNLKNPAWLAEQARTLGEAAGLRVTTWDERRLADEGFGGILAVGGASATPPRLVRLDYTPRGASRRTPTVALVGKGITFDSGGLSIKPAQGMTTMKRDMTGGAVVIATLAALAAVDCPVKVVGLVPLAENAVSGASYRPGDVVTHWGGRTTEVTNTDAEGRVVLADALAYAVAEVEPAAVVDVATLTGAVKVALGQQVGGLFANDEGLAAALGAAGAAAGEPLWRLPLAKVYEEKLASKVADADNAPGGPGAVTAALFLQHFVGRVPWAHLDIASVGDAPAESYEWTTGPTGFGVRALLGWLGSTEPLADVGA